MVPHSFLILFSEKTKIRSISFLFLFSVLALRIKLVIAKEIVKSAYLLFNSFMSNKVWLKSTLKVELVTYARTFETMDLKPEVFPFL